MAPTIESEKKSGSSGTETGTTVTRKRAMVQCTAVGMGRRMNNHLFARICLYMATGICLWLLFSDNALWKAEGEETTGEWLTRLHPVLMGVAVFGSAAVSAGSGGQSQGNAGLIWPAFLGFICLTIVELVALTHRIIILASTGHTNWGGCEDPTILALKPGYCTFISVTIIVFHLAIFITVVTATASVHRLATAITRTNTTDNDFARPSHLTVNLNSKPV